MKNLFKVIFKHSQYNTKLDLPDRAFVDLNLNTKKCYDFIIAGVINEQFLNQAST